MKNKVWNFLKQYWLPLVLFCIIIGLVVHSCNSGKDRVVTVNSDEYLEKEKKRMQDSINSYSLKMAELDTRYDSLKLLLKKERELRSLGDSIYDRKVFDLYRMNDDEHVLLLYNNLMKFPY